MKIALCGKMRSGKTTVANIMTRKYNFEQIAFGDSLKENFHATFPWVKADPKPRAYYQKYGQLMREIQKDVWVRNALEKSFNSSAENVVITDLRQANEYAELKTRGFTIIKVNAPEWLRIDRAEKDGDDFDFATLRHETETLIDQFDADYEIENTGSVGFLKKQLEEIVNELAQ